MKTHLHLVLYIFVLLVSLVIVIYSSLQLYKSINIKYFSSTTQGTITAYNTKEGNARFQSNRVQVYAPAFSFLDDKNEEIKVVTKVFNKTMKYKKGDVVTIYYNPKNPKKAFLSDSFPWKRNIVLLCAGLICLYYSIRPLVKYFN